MKVKNLTLVLIGVCMICWSGKILAQYIEQYPHFEHDGNRLSGYFKAPSDESNMTGVVLFISGDGAIPYDAHGYYDAIWQVFLDAGYAIFCWDKPGVGQSSGNWLDQSMLDRQNEVRAAIDYVKSHYKNKAKTIGLVGFSQAGWVAPALMRNNRDVNFMVGVGYAINWLEQSWYMTEMRLQRQGVSVEVLNQAKAKYRQERAFWQNNPNYDDYVRLFSNKDHPISKVRFDFIKNNVLSDASKDYIGLKQPMLILLGENDEYVDTENTFNVLTSLYREQSNVTIKIIPDATHGLLKYPNFSSQTNDIVVLVKLLLLGERAYAPDFFITLSQWLDRPNR